MRWVIVAASIVVGIVAASCSGGDGPGIASARSRVRPSTTNTTTTTTTSTPAGPSDGPTGMPKGWRPGPLDWHPCRSGGRLGCATLEVPLDWSDPTGQAIELALARIPASGRSDQRLGTVVTNPGGPGGSGVGFLASSPFDAEIGRRFDQVSWDPRGVGRSTAVTCGRSTAPAFLEADPDPDTPEEQAHLDQLAAAVSADCASSDATLLAHVSTVDVARDLEAIRLALDDGPLNYVGFSYGTQIGQVYAHMFPGQIRTMVLDGVVDTALSFTQFLMGQIDGFDASFARNVAACSAAGAAECGVGDLGVAYDRLHAEVEAAPVPAGPGRSLGPADLAVAATYVAYSGDGWRRLGPALRAGLAGDGSALVALADDYHDLGGYGIYAGVVCTDSPTPATPAAWQQFADAARARSPRFGGTVANELLPCATWPVKATGTPAAITAPGAPPIVVVGNTGDPATPVANAKAVASRLGSAVLVTADISGHTAYGSDLCVTDIVDRYLTDRVVPPGATTC